MFNKFWIIVPVLFCLQAQKILATKSMKLTVEKLANSSIKNSDEPCEDFYRYACGDYNISNFKFLNHQYNLKIMNLIISDQQQDSSLPENCSTFVQKMRNYYETCRKVTERNLTKYLEIIKPGPQLNWPILVELAASDNSGLGKWPYDKDFDVWSMLGKFQSYGLGNVIIEQEIKVTAIRRYRIILKPCRTIFNTTLPSITKWQNMLPQMNILQPAKIIDQIKETDESLINILKQFSHTTEEFEETTLRDLITSYPNIKFSTFFTAFWGEQLPSNTIIVLRNPGFFKFLNDNIWLAFDKEKLCNYLMLKFLQYVANDITIEFEDAPCIEELRKKFDLAVNFLYYHYNFAPLESLIKPDVNEIFDVEIDMLKKLFKSNRPSFERSEVDYLVDKLLNIKLNIGNLPDNVSCQNVEEFYSSVPHLEEHNYYKNHLLMLRFTKSLHLIQNETFFVVSKFKKKSLSKVFYAANLNMIILPFTHLMAPVYDVNNDNLTKYAILGFNLANELALAFDFHNLLLDFINKGDCLTQNFHFKNSLKCLQQQPEFKPMNSMADSVAIDFVKRIVTLKFINKRNRDERPYWKKYFYLCVAQNFCKNTFDYYTERDRLNQIVMNSYEFDLDFHCPEGSKLKISEQCEVY